MPMIGGDDQTALLLQFLMQMQERKRDAAAALLNTLQPGQSLASLTPKDPRKAVKAYQRVTGVKGADPNLVIVPETFQNIKDREMRGRWATLPEGTRSGLITNELINQAQSTAGRQTEASFAEEGRTRGAEATGRRIVTEAGQRKIEATPEAALGAAGEAQILGGETVGVTRAKDLAAKITEMQNTYAQGFFSDPANTEWGKMLSESGLDPLAVTQAFASGQDSLLGGMLSVKVAEAESANEAENLILKSRLQVAEEIAKKTGNRLPVRTQLALENAVEEGKDPYTIADAETVNLWSKMRKLQYGGAIQQALAQDSVYAKFMEQTLKLMKDFPDRQSMNAAMQVVAQGTARQITELQFGPRPGPEDAEKQALWDRLARGNYQGLVMTGIPDEAAETFGIDWINPDDVRTVQNMDFMQGTPADTAATTVPVAPGTPATTTTPVPGKPISQQPSSVKGQPTFVDPSAARAVTGALAIGRDTTFRRPAGGTPQQPQRTFTATPTPLRSFAGDTTSRPRPVNVPTDTSAVSTAVAATIEPVEGETAQQAIRRIRMLPANKIDEALDKLNESGMPDEEFDRVMDAFTEPAQ